MIGQEVQFVRLIVIPQRVDLGAVRIIDVSTYKISINLLQKDILVCDILLT